MRHLSLILTLLVIIAPHPLMAEWRPAPHLQTNTASNASIVTPVTGQVVQGSMVIRGSTGMDRFQSYEVDFSYEGNPTNTWFLIQESTIPIQDGVLAVWDTTTITDGQYVMRLLINLTDGTQTEVLVNDLRVRNYSPVETDTPTPTTPYITLVPGIPAASSTPWYTPSPTQPPYPVTPTPLPTNPAEITTSQMVLSLGKGAGFSMGVLAILGAYLGLRTILRNRRQG